MPAKTQLNRYHREVHHKDQSYSLVIIRSRRKTLAIHVLADGIEVRAPLKCPWIEIDRFIDSRLDWLASARAHLIEAPKPAKFLSGEYHEYRGELLPLLIYPSRQNVVSIENNQIVIGSRHPESHEYNEGLFFKQLRQDAETLFAPCLSRSVEDFPYPVSPTGLRLRRMRARWGSCSEKGEICLNTALVQKHPRALELVVTHELCHLIHFHHNAEFYALMDLAMPDWREREPLLKHRQKTGESPAAQLTLF